MNAESKKQWSISAYSDFLNTSLDVLIQKSLNTKAESVVLSLFHDVADSVPAYKDFLAERGIEPNSIQTFDDFQTIPLVAKENYLQPHSLSTLCRQGQIDSCDLIAVSSGSTGKPTFWPRFFTDELQTAIRFEQIFHDSFAADRRKTLSVICFSLGTWVGGMYTTSCCRYLASKGYPITLITPGNNKEEILRVVEEIGNNFEQIVLLGYPPFLKDVIDTGISRGIEWGQDRIKLVMAGEVFSEEWRDLVGARIGSQNPYYDSASLYGTADAGILGNETPLSICIRRFLAANPVVARTLFGESRLPTLVQYDPIARFFEVKDGVLFFSGDNGIPLVRYNISDNGGIVTYDAMLEFLAEYGFNPLAELQTNNGRGARPLPFVYVFGRSNFTVSYFGANIYPENVSVGLEQPEIRDWVTGKFVMQVKEDADKNRFLSIVVELAPGVTDNKANSETVASSILTQLLRLNSEFSNYVPSQYQMPRVVLTPTEDPEYFPVGVKHRYTRPNR